MTPFRLNIFKIATYHSKGSKYPKRKAYTTPSCSKACALIDVDLARNSNCGARVTQALLMVTQAAIGHVLRRIGSYRRLMNDD